jgi:hypothetical protein
VGWGAACTVYKRGVVSALTIIQIIFDLRCSFIYVKQECPIILNLFLLQNSRVKSKRTLKSNLILGWKFIITKNRIINILCTAEIFIRMTPLILTNSRKCCKAQYCTVVYKKRRDTNRKEIKNLQDILLEVFLNVFRCPP